MERIGRWRLRAGNGGFTLVELLVVIVILGVLAAVVVFAVTGVRDRGASSAFKTDVATLHTAEEAYYAQHGSYADVQTLASAGFLAAGSYPGNRTAMGNTILLGSNGPSGQPNSSFTVECGTQGSTPTGCVAGAGAVVRGGTLVVGETFASNTTTNAASSSNGGPHAWWETMYNGLIALDEAGNPSPELATVVPTAANGGITNNGATYTLTLRQDVQWHDSTTAVPHYLSATDVKWTFEKILFQFHSRAKNMATPIGYTAAPTCVASNIVATDGPGGRGGTVVFNFTNPYIPFLKQLNVTEAAINPATSLGGAFTSGSPGCPTQAQADTIKVGTGPFQFSSINTPNAGDGKVVRNPNYWKPGLPYLDGILMRPYTTDAPRQTALLNGDVDFLWDVPNQNVAALQANSSFATAATQSLGGGPNSVDQVIFNLWASGSNVANIAAGTATPHPILGDVRVRKAIFQALNRDQYLNTGRYGIGTVSKSPISSQIFGAETDIPLPAFDTTAAGALLDAAGWGGPRTTTPVNGTPNVRTALGNPNFTDGTPLTVRFLQGSLAFDDRVAVIKANLAAVGIDMPVTVNTSSATTQVFTNRNFDLYILNYANGYDPHVGVRRQYATDQISTSGTPNNAAGYRNSSVDTDFDTAVQTSDTTTRYNLYHDFQQRVVTDLPYVWMIETPNVRGYTTRCAGFVVWTGLFAESASCTPK
ncbi:MAG TPA: ABC transporter substrate-binding protein [Acidimicrobiales bacterium]|nr:ABC transporter substrate-binding protein [Acidimicrobiales bacterium]